MRCATTNSDRTEKEDNNEFCLIEVRVLQRLPAVQGALLCHTFQTSEKFPDSVSALSTKHKQLGSRTEVLRQAMNRGGIQLCVKTLQMTMTRAWTLEMTEELIHTPITEHDKACVLQSFVEHNVASEHLNSERPFYGRDSCNEKKREKVQNNKNSQAALLRLFSYVRPSPDP